jgi:Trypsin-like peptidase domain
VWKKVVVLVTVVVAVAGALLASFYRSPNEPWRPADLVRSTVYITVDLPSGLTPKERARGIGCTGRGSGTLIDEDLILSAKHVTEPDPSANCFYPDLGYNLIYRAYFASKPDERLNPYGCWVEPVGSSTEHDISLLQIRNLDDCIASFTGKVMPIPLTLADSDAVQMGEEVFSFGFPGRARPFIDGRGPADQAVAVWTSGVVSSVVYTSMPKDLFTTTLHASPGSSGGPAINAAGDVVGVVAAGDYLTDACGPMPTGKKAIPPPDQDRNGDGKWQIWEWCPASGSSWTYVTPVAWIFSSLYCLRREALLPPTVVQKYDCVGN